MHKATVIIPTYNRAHLLRESLASVYSQRNVELEVIVVDDESTDNTADIVHEFPNITYIRQKHGGPNTGRNRALGLATHDYIAMLDDDDLWEPYKLELELSILDRVEDAAYIFSNFAIMKDNGNLRRDGLSTWHIPSDKWADLHSKPHKVVLSEIPELAEVELTYHVVNIYTDMLEHPFVLPSTAVFRKSKVPNGTKFVENDYICGDWEFFARLSREHPAIYLPKETTINRSHEDMVRLTRTPDRIQLEMRQRMVACLWESDPEFMRANADRVHAIQARYHAAQAKQALRERDYKDVRLHSRQAHELGKHKDIALDVLRLFSSVPGGLAMLRATEATVRHFRPH